MDIEALMRRLAEAGTTVIIKADHERFADGEGYWTLVISGGALGPDRLIRAEEATLSDCLNVGLTRLAGRGSEWAWVEDYLSGS